MREKLLAIVLLGAVPAAFATQQCAEVPKAQWLRAEEVQTRLEKKGFEVRRIKREGACFEVQAKKDGKRVEVVVNPADGAIVKEREKART